MTDDKSDEKPPRIVLSTPPKSLHDKVIKYPKGMRGGMVCMWAEIGEVFFEAGVRVDDLKLKENAQFVRSIATILTAAGDLDNVPMEIRQVLASWAMSTLKVEGAASISFVAHPDGARTAQEDKRPDLVAEPEVEKPKAMPKSRSRPSFIAEG